MSIKLSEYAARRVQDEKVAWLTTVKPDGSPLPTPVWFVWSKDSFIILSDPNALKIKNIRQNARVALNFNGDPYGGNIVVFSGAASLDASGLAEDEKHSYLKKYEKEIPEIGHTVESFERNYAAVIRFQPERVRAGE